MQLFIHTNVENVRAYFSIWAAPFPQTLIRQREIKKESVCSWKMLQGSTYKMVKATLRHKSQEKITGL